MLFLDLAPAYLGAAKELQLQGTLDGIGQRGRGVSAADSFDRLELDGPLRIQRSHKAPCRVTHRSSLTSCRAVDS